MSTIEIEFAGETYEVDAVGIELVKVRLLEALGGIYGVPPGGFGVVTEESYLALAKNLVVLYLHSARQQEPKVEVKWRDHPEDRKPEVHRIEPARICQMCRWCVFEATATSSVSNVRRGECRLMPPSFTTGSGVGKWEWPRVHPRDWCSKWEERKP